MGFSACAKKMVVNSNCSVSNHIERFDYTNIRFRRRSIHLHFVLAFERWIEMKEWLVRLSLLAFG
jgi:hypothetical protein